MRAFSSASVVSLSSKRGASTPARRAEPFLAWSQNDLHLPAERNMSGRRRLDIEHRRIDLRAPACAAALSRMAEKAFSFAGRRRRWIDGPKGTWDVFPLALATRRRATCTEWGASSTGATRRSAPLRLSPRRAASHKRERRWAKPASAPQRPLDRRRTGRARPPRTLRNRRRSHAESGRPRPSRACLARAAVRSTRFVDEAAKRDRGAAGLGGEPFPVAGQQRHFARDDAELGRPRPRGRAAGSLASSRRRCPPRAPEIEVDDFAGRVLERQDRTLGPRGDRLPNGQRDVMQRPGGDQARPSKAE